MGQPRASTVAVTMFQHAWLVLFLLKLSIWISAAAEEAGSSSSTGAQVQLAYNTSCGPHCISGRVQLLVTNASSLPRAGLGAKLPPGWVGSISVCEDMPLSPTWEDQDATVVCRQLGYTAGVASLGTSAQAGLTLDDIGCNGTEPGLQWCPGELHQEPRLCLPAWATCQGVPTTGPSAGNIIAGTIAGGVCLVAACLSWYLLRRSRARAAAAATTKYAAGAAAAAAVAATARSRSSADISAQERRHSQPHHLSSGQQPVHHTNEPAHHSRVPGSPRGRGSTSSSRNTHSLEVPPRTKSNSPGAAHHTHPVRQDTHQGPKQGTKAGRQQRPPTEVPRTKEVAHDESLSEEQPAAAAAAKARTAAELPGDSSGVVQSPEAAASNQAGPSVSTEAVDADRAGAT